MFINKFRIQTVLFCMLILTSNGVCADWPFEFDDAYNAAQMKRSLFHKMDQTKDNVISADDQQAWEEFKHYDTNKNGKIEFDEFSKQKKVSYDNLGTTVLRNIVFKTVAGEKALMDIYLPTQKKFDSAPVFYYTHGGGWVGGVKEPKDFAKDLFKRLNSEGVCCVSIDYRMTKPWDKDDQVVMRDSVIDCKDGLRFLKKHEKVLKINTDRIVTFGGSAGGHLSLMLTYSDADDFKGIK